MTKAFLLATTAGLMWAVPAQAQEVTDPVDDGSVTSSADQPVVDTGEVTLKGHHHHRAGPRAAAGRRADRGERGERGGAAELGRERHPRAEPARPVAARVLHRQRGERVGAHPRHRHGRRQPRPGKLGRGVRRRRVPLTVRQRAGRPGSDRAGRGPARAAGDAVRPQRVGGPAQHRHRPAEPQSGGGLWLGHLRQLRLLPLRGGRQPAARRHLRGAPGRHLHETRRLLPRRGEQHAHQQPRPLSRARQGAVGADAGPDRCCCRPTIPRRRRRAAPPPSSSRSSRRWRRSAPV